MSLPPSVFYRAINWDFVMCTAMILLYTRERWVEPMYLPKLPYSLLFHQTMSILNTCGSISPRDLARQVLTLSVFKNVSREDYALLLRHLLENGLLERSEEEGLMIGESGEALVNNYDFLAVFTVPLEYTVRCGSEIIGTVQNPFPAGAQFALAGLAWEVTELDRKALEIYVKKIKGISANMWTDVGNEYVHIKVMKKIIEVIRSDEEYAFLDELALKRLLEIRKMCRCAASGVEYSESANALPGSVLASNDERMVLPLTDTSYAVFPFLGTRGTMALVYALRQRGFTAEAYVQRYIPVCIEVTTDKGIDALRAALTEIKIHGADKYSFRIPENCEIVGKFNDYLPREMLTKQYVEDHLDTGELEFME